MLPESAVDCHCIWEEFFGGGSFLGKSFFFLVVDEMRAVIFNFPLLLCQHYRCVFHLERMLIWDTGALGFPEHCLEC